MMCDLVTGGKGSSVGGPGEDDLASRSAWETGILDRRVRGNVKDTIGE